MKLNIAKYAGMTYLYIKGHKYTIGRIDPDGRLWIFKEPVKDIVEAKSIAIFILNDHVGNMETKVKLAGQMFDLLNKTRGGDKIKFDKRIFGDKDSRVVSHVGGRIIGTLYEKYRIWYLNIGIDPGNLTGIFELGEQQSLEDAMEVVRFIMAGQMPPDRRKEKDWYRGRRLSYDTRTIDYPSKSITVFHPVIDGEIKSINRTNVTDAIEEGKRIIDQELAA